MKLMLENIKIALQSVKSNLLRTVLTIFIIAIGITALVGILTAIDSIKHSINDNFTSMGANTFNIRNKGSKLRAGKGGTKPQNPKTPKPLINVTQLISSHHLYFFKYKFKRC